MLTQAYQRREAAFRHREKRELACRIVEKLFANDAPGVELRETKDDDLLVVEAWRAKWPADLIYMRPNWDCRIERRKIIRREARLDLAICKNGTIYGIALGRVSRRRVVATIHFIERDPIQNPLEELVGPLCVTYLEELAKLTGCKEICIDRPVKALLEYYKALGFEREIKRGGRVLRLVQLINIDRSQDL